MPAFHYRDLPSLISSSVGRKMIAIRGFQTLWPLVSLAARLWRRSLTRTRVVAVVGSYGKTTTRWAIQEVLGLRGARIQLGNLKAYVPRALLRIRQSAPYGVLEVAIDGPGQMMRQARTVRPDIVVVTSVGSEHNRSLKTLENTRHEKAQMVRHLSPSGVAVLNGDDPNVLWMASQTAARVITFGTQIHNQVRASHIQLEWPKGIRFRVHLDGNSYDVRCRMFGRHMIYPLLAATVIGTVAGIPTGTIIDRVGRVTPCNGRLKAVELTNGSILLRDEIKSSDETIHAALDLLEEVPAKTRILVLGDVSEPPGTVGSVYRKIGGRFPKVASDVVIIGSNCQRYRAEARRQGFPVARILDSRHDLEKAATFLQEKLQPGTVVLVKGRDNQKLERISLRLMGREVHCRLKVCRANIPCECCPELSRRPRP